MTELQHRVIHRIWRFGDNVSAEQVLACPHRQFSDCREVWPYIFERLLPGFAEVVRQGDVIVAGCQFGEGEISEAVPKALAEIGIFAVIAASVSPDFCCAASRGMLHVVEQADLFQCVHTGDHLSIDIAKGEIYFKSRIFHFISVRPSELIGRAGMHQ